MNPESFNLQTVEIVCASALCLLPLALLGISAALAKHNSPKEKVYSPDQFSVNDAINLNNLSNKHRSVSIPLSGDPLRRGK